MPAWPTRRGIIPQVSTPSSATPSRGVIVLAGPSGAGKSRLASRLGLPVLRLDDFYKEGDDPSLPLIDEGANAGLVDWDHPESWHLEAAVTAIDTLCRVGAVEVPIYSIPDNGSVGTQQVVLDEHVLFVAEGIFAAEIVPHCRELGLLEAAWCVRQHPVLTFWRRLSRDLRERRKPPHVLLWRGLALMRAQREVVSRAVALGCEPVTPDQAYARTARPAVPSHRPAGRGGPDR